MNIRALTSIFILAFVLIGIPLTLPQLIRFVKNKVVPLQKENDVTISDNSLDLDGNDNGDVVGAFIDNPPTPTPIRKGSTIKPIPTIPVPTSTTNNPESNSPSSNESNNNPSNQQSNTNPKPPAQNTGTPTPTPIPTSSIATPTPTPDNTPLEASWEVGKTNTLLATITANKLLKRCLWKVWGIDPNVEGSEGEEIANGNSCTISSPVWRTNGTRKLWVRAEAVSGETKEFEGTLLSQ